MESPKPAPKKARLAITDEMTALIKADEANQKQWEDVMEEVKSGTVRDQGNILFSILGAFLSHLLELDIH